MKIKISKSGNRFLVDPLERSGSPRIGVGASMDAALGDFLRSYQEELGVEIELDPSVESAELARRKRSLSSR